MIQCMKALMSYEAAVSGVCLFKCNVSPSTLQDLQVASEQVKHGNNLAYQHRAPPPAFTSRLAGLVWENASTGTGAIRSMSAVQRHAELLYAETLFTKVKPSVNLDYRMLKCCLRPC